MSILIGIDIGGTKCAVSFGETESETLRILAKKIFATPDRDPNAAIQKIISLIWELARENKLDAGEISAIGIACGGPLDSDRGVILSPPNLPGWDNIGIVSEIVKIFKTPCGLQNDANACALAEWKFGAGRGLRDMVFMTFGTGLGAGLILNGELYSGANGNAGEIGHIRLAEYGPVGYGKRGSFEGFCSGAGIAKIAREKIAEKLQMGERPAVCADLAKLDSVTAKSLAQAAEAGDKLAIEAYEESGRMLGLGLSAIVDIINPQAIIIGGVFSRSRELLWPRAEEVLRREALGVSLKACKILPAGLGENVGDYASLSVAQYELEKAQAGTRR